MKKITFYLIMLCFPLSMLAQKQGVIIYDVIIKMETNIDLNNIPDAQAIPGLAEMLAKMPKSNTQKMELLFSEKETLYKNFSNDSSSNETSISDGDENVQIKMIMKMPENKLYKDLSSKQIVEQRKMFDKKFLIKYLDDKISWKMTGQQDSILDYPCYQAEYTKDSIKVIAWFTPNIPISAGPSKYGQLPGLILKVDIDNGRTTIIAKRIVSKKLEKGEIEKPSKGKKVSLDEYEKIQKDKQKEMEEMYGGKKGVIIKMETE